MSEFFSRLFTSDFMPHGHCYFWQPSILWLHVVSDVFIAGAYFTIPVALFYFARKRVDLAFNWMFALFGVFILACGSTHLLEIWTVWFGTYRLSGIVKAITAIASVPTAILLFNLIPKALVLPSPRELHLVNERLRKEIAERREAEARANALNSELESRVENAIRKEQEAVRHFRSISEMMPQLVWTALPSGMQDYFNKRWADITGLKMETIEAQGWLPLVHADDYEQVLTSWNEALSSGKPFEGEFRISLSDGSYRWFLARAHPFVDSEGKITKWFGTCTDIDVQKKLNEERQHHLTEERAARTALERANQMKDEFLATLSHELRTPLNSILGWAQLLRKGKLGEEKKDQAVEVIERNTRTLAQIIDDLLDMSRILTGKVRLDLQLVPLFPIVDAAVEALKPTAEAKGITLEKKVAGDIGTLKLDPARFQQIIWNLVSNALKFTPRGGKVTVSVEPGDSHVEISVVDNGEGISAEFLPYVFDRFRQADSSPSRKFGGLGLGLAIVKQLVELHGGRVRAKSAGAGQGATFIVEIPLLLSTTLDEREEFGIEHHWRSSSASLLPQTLEGICVVVVDDEPDARELLREILSERNATVHVGSCAEEGLSLIQTYKPDLIISDIGMPGIDGYEFMKKIRQLPVEQGGKTPAVALTAFARSDDRIKVLRSGYQIHVAKPVESSELVAVVASLTVAA